MILSNQIYDRLSEKNKIELALIRIDNLYYLDDKTI